MATKTPSEVVSENVEVLRRVKGLTQESVASAMGYTQTAANRRLKNLVRWDVDEITAVAELLEVPAGYLLQEHPNFPTI